MTESPFQILLPYFCNIFASLKNNPIKSGMVSKIGDYWKKNELPFKTM